MTICAPHPAFKVGDCRTTSDEKRSWHRLEADLVRRSGLEKEETAITSSQHVILLNVQGNSERGQYFIDGRNAGFVARKPGALLFIPAGCSWRGWEAGASTAAYLSILVKPVHVQANAGLSALRLHHPAQDRAGKGLPAPFRHVCHRYALHAPRTLNWLRREK